MLGFWIWGDKVNDNVIIASIFIMLAIFDFLSVQFVYPGAQ